MIFITKISLVWGEATADKRFGAYWSQKVQLWWQQLLLKMAAVFVDFSKNKWHQWHLQIIIRRSLQWIKIKEKCSCSPIRHRVAPYEEFFSWDSRQGYRSRPMAKRRRKCASTTPFSSTSLFPSATLHRRSFFSDRPEILSAHIRSPEIAWTSPVRLQHHSIFSAWQVRSHRHQTLQAPVSIKPMVLYHPPCILIHPRSSCWKHLETYSLWLVLFQIYPQPAGPILRNFSGCTISKVHVWCNALTLSKVTTS